MTTNVPGDLHTYREVTERVLPHAEGLIAQYAGVNDRGLAITDIWESKAHCDRFAAEHLLPTLRELLGERLGQGEGLTVDFIATDEYPGAAS